MLKTVLFFKLSYADYKVIKNWKEKKANVSFNYF